MKKTLFTIILVFIFNSLVSQNLLDDKYYFVHGSELFRIKKSNDTIFEFKCNSEFKCSEQYRKKFKILKNKIVGQKEILAIERIDPIPMSVNSIRDDRYKIIGFEKIGKGKLKFINEAKKYNLDALSVIPFEIQFLNEKFGFTYYTESFLSKLRTAYEISPKQVEQIFSDLKKNTQEIDLYKNTETGDIYRSGITAELIAIEMIKLKLSPLNAKDRIEKALRKQQ
jgi:hypothetical protein